MAFTFTVETGEGLPTATSYLSVAEANDYFAIDAASTKWVELDATQKEHFLAWASRLLDQKCEYRGNIVSETQGLRWPRTYVRDRDGIVISSVQVPKQIKHATCELAKFLFSGSDLTTGQDVQQLLRMKADVIELEWQEGATQIETPSIINAILRPLGFLRIGGYGAAKIIKTG